MAHTKGYSLPQVSGASIPSARINCSRVSAGVDHVVEFPEAGHVDGVGVCVRIRDHLRLAGGALRRIADRVELAAVPEPHGTLEPHRPSSAVDDAADPTGHLAGHRMLRAHRLEHRDGDPCFDPGSRGVLTRHPAPGPGCPLDAGADVEPSGCLVGPLTGPSGG